MKHTNALCRGVAILLLLLSASLYSFAQNNFKVTGKVSDEAGKPLEGISVQVKGTSNGTVTKADGTFEIMAPSGNSTLVVSSVGFAEREIAIGGKNSITVTLSNATADLSKARLASKLPLKRRDNE